MEDKNLGIVTIGYGSEHERKVKITNMVRCEFSDHRLVTVAKTEEGCYLLSVENPVSSGRETQTSMYLTEGSAVALLSTYMLYLEHNEIDADELFKKYMLSDKEIKYEFSPKINDYEQGKKNI